MKAIDEPIHLAEYDQAWPAIFSAERNRVATALRFPLECLEHIGSTAVPGLLAKPVVDIMLGVDGWPPRAAIGENIERLGYESFGEAGVPERLYFRLRGTTNFNLHVVCCNGNHWRSNIALRNYLRRNEAAQDRYRQGKLAAVSAGGATLLAYSEAKSPVVTALLEEALAHENAGWQMHQKNFDSEE